MATSNKYLGPNRGRWKVQNGAFVAGTFLVIYLSPRYGYLGLFGKGH